VFSAQPSARSANSQDGDYGEVEMTHADYTGDMERYASNPRRHHRCVRAGQEICELAGVGNRLIAEAVV
jgi:hypothetical protein